MFVRGASKYESGRCGCRPARARDENRYGVKAIPALIAAFAGGKTTDDALTALTGKSLDDLNRDFREWGFTNTEVFPYSELYSPGIDPRIKAGFKWSTRKQPQ